MRGLARGLGCTGRVQSPTFQLVRIYPGPLPLAHVDLYRLPAGGPLDDLDLEDRLAQGVVVVEWGQRLPGWCTARVAFEVLGAQARKLTLVEAPSAWTW